VSRKEREKKRKMRKGNADQLDYAKIATEMGKSLRKQKIDRQRAMKELQGH
jgi:DNA-directed RNA polymerase specialized sigma24 family protein